MKEIIERILACESAAVMGHVNADADSLGSCYAMAQFLRGLGKRAQVFLEEKPDRYLEFMSDEYTVFENGMETAEFELCICLDSGDIDRLGERRAIFDRAKTTINIDHHRTNTKFADLNYVDADASATGEILCEMFKLSGKPMDKEIAQNLYIAMCTDTGCFKFSSVKPKTMRAAADLMEYGFDHAELIRLLFDSHSMAETKFRGEVMRNVKSYDGGRISLVSIADDLCAKVGLAEEDMPNVVDIPRCVEGTEIAVALKRRDNKVKINLRSNGDADVANIALKFGGGGHAKAAGGAIEGVSIEEAEKMVVAACREELG